MIELSIISIGPKTDYTATIDWSGTNTSKDAIAYFKDDDTFVTIGVPYEFVQKSRHELNVFGIFTERASDDRRAWQILYTKKAKPTIQIRHSDYGGISFETDKDDVLFIAEQWDAPNPDDDWRSRTIIQANGQNYHSDMCGSIISINRRFILLREYIKHKLEAIVYDAGKGVLDLSHQGFRKSYEREYNLAKRFLSEGEEIFYVDEKTNLSDNNVGFYEPNDYWMDMRVARVVLPDKLGDIVERYGFTAYGTYSYAPIDRLKVMNICIFSKQKVNFKTGDGVENGIMPTDVPDVCRIEIKDGMVDVYKNLATIEVFSSKNESIYSNEKNARLGGIFNYVIPPEAIEIAYKMIEEFANNVEQ